MGGGVFKSSALPVTGWFVVMWPLSTWAGGQNYLDYNSNHKKAVVKKNLSMQEE